MAKSKKTSDAFDMADDIRNSKCDEFNIIAPNGRDKSTPQAACENLFVDRIATQIAPPFDSPTTLRPVYRGT